jgi:hypothetical protein
LIADVVAVGRRGYFDALTYNLVYSLPTVPGFGKNIPDGYETVSARGSLNFSSQVMRKMSPASGLPSGGGTVRIVAGRAVRRQANLRRATPRGCTPRAPQKVDKKWPPKCMGGHSIDCDFADVKMR